MKKMKRSIQNEGERRTKGFPADWFGVVDTQVLEYARTDLADYYTESKLWCLYYRAEPSVIQVKSLTTFPLFPCSSSIKLGAILWGLREITWNNMKTQYSVPGTFRCLPCISSLFPYSTVSTVIVKTRFLLSYSFGERIKKLPQLVEYALS